jgi:hypothetical protein
VEEFETGEALPLLVPGPIPDAGLGVAEGLMAGNMPAALPAPISDVDTPFRSGCGPSGGAGTVGEPGGEPGGEDDDVDGEADGDAAVTATTSKAAGGVHFAVVTMLAVAISFTELTELALAATGICASRAAGWVSETELIVHEAVPLPLAQPLVNVGFWLAGWAVSVRVTFETEPFCAATDTAYVAFWPRWMLDWVVWTVTHSPVAAFGALELALGLGLAAM